MYINRHNYEEFFILYLDNELGREDRESVELFVQGNPDLAEELNLLRQTRFAADPAVVFEGREELMRPAGGQGITPGNYEEWLLLYIDNELTAGQRTAVENFAATHPAIKEELEILQHTRLQPETAIVFPFKETLYHKEEKARVVTIRWWRIAAAAAVLFAIGTIGFYSLNKKPVTGTGTVASGPKIRNNSTVKPVNETRVDNNTAVAGKKNESVRNPGIKPESKDQVIQNSAITGTQKTQQHDQVQVKENEQPVIAMQDEKNPNNLPSSVRNPNMKGSVDQGNPFASLDGPSNRVLTNSDENSRPLNVTPAIAHPLDHTDQVTYANQSEKKNNVRGLLRKITRTFEKTTNIKATDDDDRLLVGGLAIRL